MIDRRAFRALMLAAGMFAAHSSWSGAARAQQDPQPTDTQEWSYRLAPYIWLPALSGTLRVDTGDPPADVDTSFLDVLDFAFLIIGEARKDKWGLLGEFNYLDLSHSAETDGLIYLGAKARLTGVMGALTGSYRVLEGRDTSLDILAGARAWRLDLKIDYRAGSLPAKTARGSRSWVDPVVGLRGRIGLTERLFLTGLLDAGGFGVGSDFQWEANAALGYRFNQTISVSFGYRHLDLDFKDGGFVVDASLSGSYVMVGFEF